MASSRAKPQLIKKIDACVDLKPCLAEHKMCVFSHLFSFAAFAVFKAFPWCLLCLLFHRAIVILRSKSTSGELNQCSRKGEGKNRNRNCEDNPIVPMPLDSIRIKTKKGFGGCKMLLYLLICHAYKRSIREP